MITNGTRVENVDGLRGTVIGEPEQTPIGLMVTVKFDDAFITGTPSGKVDLRVDDLTELADDTARPVGEAHGEPLSHGQLMDICDDLDSVEHHADCRCQCGAVRDDTDPLVSWQHDRHCECECGALTDEQSVDAS